MSIRLIWLARVAADERIKPTAVRLAVAINHLADDEGRVHCRMSDLTPHCQVSGRRMLPHLESLIDRRYLASEFVSPQGRVAVRITMPPAPKAPASAKAKPVRQANARVVKVAALPRPQAPLPLFRVDLETDDELLSLVLPSKSVEGMVAAVLPPAK